MSATGIDDAPLSAARWLGLAAVPRASGEAGEHETIALDVEELLNHTRFDRGDMPAGGAATSLLRYGLRCYAGRHVDEAFLRTLSRDIAAALARFEPRLDPGSIEVQPLQGARHVRSQCRLRLSARLKRGGPAIDWRIRFDADFGRVAIDRGAAQAGMRG